MAMTTAIITAVAATGAAVMDTVTNVQNQRAQEDINKANAVIAENEAAAARMESASQANSLRSAARRQIASSEAGMIASGNIGGSSDAIAIDSLLNLSKDLSNLKYNSDSRAVSALNAAENYRYNAEIARMNKTSALIGGSLNTVAAAGKSVGQMYGWGMIGGKSTGSGGSK